MHFRPEFSLLMKKLLMAAHRIIIVKLASKLIITDAGAEFEQTSVV